MVEDTAIDENDIFHYIELLRARIIDNPNDWYEIIKVGWGQLLRESPPSVNIDVVLEAGFSPLSWELSLVNCAYSLAESIAQRVSPFEGGQQMGHSILVDFNLNPADIPVANNELCNNVFRLLEWNDAIVRIEPNAIKIIGFFWYVELIRKNINHRINTFADQSLIIQSICESLESILDIPSQGLIDYIRQVEQVVNIQLDSWDMSFIRFPYGV